VKGAKQIDSVQTATSAGTDRSGVTTPDPERWVEEFGDYLFQYALARLRNRTRAEDLVQETFLAALRGQSEFAGRSAERSWPVGILRNKIYDYYRTAHRERSFTDLEFYADEESDQFVASGLRRGAWIHELGPVEWSPQTEQSLDQEEFWSTFRSCADKLPGSVGRVFVLRQTAGPRKAAEPPWMRGFGELGDLKEESAKIMTLIEEEFAR
jgi:RNA polymerase sigma factor (sigma-70 family)